ERPLLDVHVAEEEAVALARDAAQLRDALIDQARIEPVAGPRDRLERRPDGVRDADPDAPQCVALVAELLRPEVVDALALAAVLEAVREPARVEPAEEPGGALRRRREAADVVVELQLEEVAVLAHVAGARVREGE